MGTSSNRSAGTQVTKNGVTQGNVLVDPVTGFPIGVIRDNAGVRRLAVDANLSADSITVDTRDLSPTTDQVGIGDKTSGYFLKINPDGSVDANVSIQATSDNIAIRDETSGNKLKVNPDGSINAVIGGTGGTQNPVSTFNSVTSVASSVSTTIVTYTVPALKTANLQRLEVSGTNIAQYDVLINNVLQARRRTYFGSSLNETFDFTAEIDLGFKLNSGDIVKINVIHQRPDLGDFEGRVQVVEIG